MENPSVGILSIPNADEFVDGFSGVLKTYFPNNVHEYGTLLPPDLRQHNYNGRHVTPQVWKDEFKGGQHPNAYEKSYINSSLKTAHTNFDKSKRSSTSSNATVEKSKEISNKINDKKSIETSIKIVKEISKVDKSSISTDAKKKNNLFSKILEIPFFMNLPLPIPNDISKEKLLSGTVIKKKSNLKSSSLNSFSGNSTTPFITNTTPNAAKVTSEKKTSSMETLINKRKQRKEFYDSEENKRAETGRGKTGEKSAVKRKYVDSESSDSEAVEYKQTKKASKKPLKLSKVNDKEKHLITFSLPDSFSQKDPIPPDSDLISPVSDKDTIDADKKLVSKKENRKEEKNSGDNSKNVGPSGPGEKVEIDMIKTKSIETPHISKSSSKIVNETEDGKLNEKELYSTSVLSSKKEVSTKSKNSSKNTLLDLKIADKNSGSPKSSLKKELLRGSVSPPNSEVKRQDTQTKSTSGSIKQKSEKSSAVLKKSDIKKSRNKTSPTSKKLFEEKSDDTNGKEMDKDKEIGEKDRAEDDEDGRREFGKEKEEREKERTKEKEEREKERAKEKEEREKDRVRAKDKDEGEKDRVRTKEEGEKDRVRTKDKEEGEKDRVRAKDKEEEDRSRNSKSSKSENRKEGSGSATVSSAKEKESVKSSSGKRKPSPSNSDRGESKRKRNEENQRRPSELSSRRSHSPPSKRYSSRRDSDRRSRSPERRSRDERGRYDRSRSRDRERRRSNRSGSKDNHASPRYNGDSRSRKDEKRDSDRKRRDGDDRREYSSSRRDSVTETGGRRSHSKDSRRKSSSPKKKSSPASTKKQNFIKPGPVSSTPEKVSITSNTLPKSVLKLTDYIARKNDGTPPPPPPLSKTLLSTSVTGKNLISTPTPTTVVSNLVNSQAVNSPSTPVSTPSQPTAYFISKKLLPIFPQFLEESLPELHLDFQSTARLHKRLGDGLKKENPGNVKKTKEALCHQAACSIYYLKHFFILEQRGLQDIKKRERVMKDFSHPFYSSSTTFVYDRISELRKYKLYGIASVLLQLLALVEEKAVFWKELEIERLSHNHFLNPISSGEKEVQTMMTLMQENRINILRHHSIQRLKSDALSLLTANYSEKIREKYKVIECSPRLNLDEAMKKAVGLVEEFAAENEFSQFCFLKPKPPIQQSNSGNVSTNSKSTPPS
ncbi:hypothetical protein HDU92_002581 [Lobulomyces angularis]|nr:hypothetical protein HDU92_002581 [Lobulomyces angularis]